MLKEKDFFQLIQLILGFSVSLQAYKNDTVFQLILVKAPSDQLIRVQIVNFLIHYVHTGKSEICLLQI